MAVSKLRGNGICVRLTLERIDDACSGRHGWMYASLDERGGGVSFEAIGRRRETSCG